MYAAPNSTLTPATNKEREVASALNRLRCAHGEMRDRLDLLASRLQIALVPSPPIGSGSDAAALFSSELAQSISSQADCAYCAAGIIADLPARLEI